MNNQIIESTELFNICKDIDELIHSKNNNETNDIENDPDSNNDEIPQTNFNCVELNKNIHERISILINSDEFKNVFNTYNGSLNQNINITYEENEEEDPNIESINNLNEFYTNKINDIIRETVSKVVSGADDLGESEDEIIDNILPQIDTEVDVSELVQDINIKPERETYSLIFHNKIKITPSPNTYISIICLLNPESQIIARIFFDNIQNKYTYDYNGFDYLVEILDFNNYTRFIEPDNFNKYIELPNNVKRQCIDKYEMFNCLFINRQNNTISVFGKLTNYQDLDKSQIYLSYVSNIINNLSAYDLNDNQVKFISPILNHLFIIINKLNDINNTIVFPVVIFKEPNIKTNIPFELS